MSTGDNISIPRESSSPQRRASGSTAPARWEGCAISKPPPTAWTPGVPPPLGKGIHLCYLKC